MNEEQLALRQAVNDKRPDVTDPDVWPADLASLAGRLLPALDVIDALKGLAVATNGPTDRLVAAAQAVHDAREALAALERVSPLAAWKLEHPPITDPLDGVTYGCANPTCSFLDSAALHHRRWRSS